ncbi:MAG TPA: amino acid adenylation domain-containing protein [Casimicrobiaceae bacterium]
MTEPEARPANAAADEVERRAAHRSNRVQDAAAADVSYVETMSFGQQRLWVLDKLLPDRSVYNSPRAQRIVGPLDVPALEKSIDEIVRRHDALRTRFAVIDGEPRQLVAPPSPFRLQIEDVSALPADERAAMARRQVATACSEPFDLERGPLFRARLLRLAPDEHWLSLNLHHIVTDYWSSAVFSRELAALYGAFRRGEASPLAPLPVQYADFAVWQREWLQGPVLQRQLDFWRSTLADVATLELPFDRPRPAVASARGGSVRFTIDGALTSALKALSLRERATLFMTLLAAFQVLLHRWSGQDDIAVGVPIAGRSRPELEGLIGFFINTLVLRGDLSGNPSFVEFLARVRQRSLDAYAHQDLPFEKLVEELAPRRDLSRNPLFQVSFALQNTPPPDWRLPGLEIEPVGGIVNNNAKFDLYLAVTEAAGLLQGRIEYAAALFDAATVEHMARQWQVLLAAIVANPGQGIDRLPLQSPSERARLLVESSRLAPAGAGPASVHELFAAQAARTPDAIAVRDASTTLSYRELDARANQLARYLEADGVRHETLVGVAMERGAELATALLGILKAGGAYVPLDPALPGERLSLMLDDAGRPRVLTQQRLLERLPTDAGSTLCIDREWERIGGGDHSDPARRAGGSDAAYVMYTSGSTGRPKGVVIPHRAIVRLVVGTDYLQLGAGDVVAHIANPAFDAATFEIWGALLNGAQLAVIPYQTTLSPPAFAAALDHLGVTAMFVTTALFNQLARSAPALFRGRDVLFGGEAVEPRWVEAVLRDGGPRRLLHVYGPTEATTFATWHEVRGMATDAATVPIGRPIADTEVYVLDRLREPVPIGVPGEIHIGGPGLARGYLQEPDLTAERFVLHPFDTTPGARLYRSGDRARMRADGGLEFLGRFDRQVKIRGHRIEVDEVEAALSRLPQVAEAVILVHGETSDTRQLTAYIVAAPDTHPTPAEVWAQLRRTLPDYMAPAAIVMLVAMPLTSNGKVDRRALPAPGDLAQQRTGWHVPPRDPLDQIVAAIWEELLGVRNIGVSDNFFDLGGHSLLAAQMIDAIEQASGCKLPLTTLFADPTIEHLTAAMRSSAREDRAPLVALSATGNRPPFFFLHGDFTGGGFFTHKLARALGDDQPFYAVHPHGLIDTAVPDTIEAMAAERLPAVRAARPRGPYVLGGHCAGGMVALEIARQLVREGEEVVCVVMIDTVAPQPPKLVFPGISVGAELPRPRRRNAARSPDGNAGGNTIARYRDVVRRYSPEPYAGRLVVLRPESHGDTRPAMGWTAFSPQAQTIVVPGDHHTVITRHIDAMAARLRSYLHQ